jgi:hypothetical protein
MTTPVNSPAGIPETNEPINDEAVRDEAHAIEHLRLRRVKRDQVTPVPARLDALLPENHLARLVWGVVERLELSAFYRQTTVREDGPGKRPRIRRFWWRCGCTRRVKA